MQAEKKLMDARISRARRSAGLIICLYGDGKGKSSSAFGTVCRCLGHGKRVGVVQFIKGKWKTGEQKFFSALPNVEYRCMGTGFTWDTQDRERDMQAAARTWEEAALMLKDPGLALVVLDEIHYLFSYEYLDPCMVIDSLQARPARQHVILTGRPRIQSLIDIADTVSEVLEVKHAFNQGVKAQKGVEW